MKNSSPLRILHLVAIRGKGGTGASTLSLVEGLADRGHKLAVVCFKRGLLYKSLKDKGKVELITGIKMAPGLRVHHWIRDLLKLKPFVDDFKPHIVHCHSSPDYWLGFLLSLVTGAPLVRTRHVPVPLRPHALNRFLFWKTAAVVAVSHAVGDRYFTGVGWRPEKVKVIYDGVDTRRFNLRVDGGEIRKKLGVSRDEILIGSIARYSKVKGLPYFLEALEKLTAKDSRVRGLIVGRVKSRSLYERLKERLKERELEERVTLWEHQDRVEEISAALDIAVLSSVGSEGSSRVALEVGASGKPLVATRVGALPEIVVLGKTGYIVPPRDVESQLRFLELLLPPFPRKELGLNAKRRVAGLFPAERFVVKMESLYRRILEESEDLG